MVRDNSGKSSKQCGDDLHHLAPCFWGFGQWGDVPSNRLLWMVQAIQEKSGQSSRCSGVALKLEDLTSLLQSVMSSGPFPSNDFRGIHINYMTICKLYIPLVNIHT